MSAPLVIAEAGVNHNGDLDRALAMVRVAREAGADIVKFQAFRADAIASPGAAAAAYQRRNAGAERQRDMLAKLEFGMDRFAVLARACADAGIEFLATPFEADMAAPLRDLGMKRIKVASGELTNAPALRQFAALGLPVLLSTGMATLDEVEAAIRALESAGLPRREVTLLHCTSLYPAPPATANLRAIAAMRAATGCAVGYSDHTLGDHIAVAAVALGATVIEKHFTLDRTLPGPDHRASLEPAELKAMIARLRETAAALGDGVKRPQPDEWETARLVRRSWHLRRDLPAGRSLVADDLVLTRPAAGLAPDAPPIARRLVRAMRAGDPVRAEDVE
jgi:sialic acid synthase SpsE